MNEIGCAGNLAVSIKNEFLVAKFSLSKNVMQQIVDVKRETADFSLK